MIVLLFLLGATKDFCRQELKEAPSDKCDDDSICGQQWLQQQGKNTAAVTV